MKVRSHERWHVESALEQESGDQPRHNAHSQREEAEGLAQTAEHQGVGARVAEKELEGEQQKAKAHHTPSPPRQFLRDPRPRGGLAAVVRLQVRQLA